MAKTIVVKTDDETRRRAEVMAREHPFADGNLSTYLRGLINEAWSKREQPAGGNHELAPRAN